MKTVFRYPGGKTKFLKTLSLFIDHLLINENSFCDAFIGGGSVLLYVAEKFPNIKLYANDKDPWIYSFWKIASSSDSNQLNSLLELIKQPVSLDRFYLLRDTKPTTEVEMAYYSLFFNRTTFSGISKSGPIGGKSQKSKWKIDCRYNSEKIINNINKINLLLKNRLTIENKDFNEYEILKTDIPTYLDPPYVKAGSQLYNFYMDLEEHNKLSLILKNKKNWVLSYDNCSEVHNFYNWSNILTFDAKYSINGVKNTWKNDKEVIITSWKV